jgi:Sister chromatid cohesion protein Dcc1
MDTKEPPNVSTLITRQDLNQKIQASESELTAALHDINALDVHGYIRRICKISLNEQKRDVIQTIVEYGWNINCIDQQKCMQYVQNADTILLVEALKQLGTEVSDHIWHLDSNKIALSIAHSLFQERLQQSSNHVRNSIYIK